MQAVGVSRIVAAVRRIALPSQGLQTPAPLDVDVAVDERDRELRRLDVEADRAAALEAAEGELAALEIVRCGGVRERALESVDPACERPRQDALAQAREHNRVPRVREP